MKKINLPFFVFEVLQTVNMVLEVIFRGNPENKTCLPRVFTPRSIEAKSIEPSSEGSEFGFKVSFWANGVYIDAVSEGYDSQAYGDVHRTKAVRIRARRHGSQQGFVVLEVPLEDLLLAEKYARFEADCLRHGVTIPDVIVAARARQQAALQVIHDLLKS